MCCEFMVWRKENLINVLDDAKKKKKIEQGGETLRLVAAENGVHPVRQRGTG